MATAVVYGSTTGNTQEIAESIAQKLGAEALDISSKPDLNQYDKLVLGASTWGDGDFQDDWEEFDFNSVDFSGKTVALFGLGDQEGYPDTYCDAIGLIYEHLNGANVVGAWDTDGYEFDDSKALKDGKFLGLALDTDNQEELNEERIDKWVELIKADFS